MQHGRAAEAIVGQNLALLSIGHPETCHSGPNAPEFVNMFVSPYDEVLLQRSTRVAGVRQPYQGDSSSIFLRTAPSGRAHTFFSSSRNSLFQEEISTSGRCCLASFLERFCSF